MDQLQKVICSFFFWWIAAGKILVLPILLPLFKHFLSKLLKKKKRKEGFSDFHYFANSFVYQSKIKDTQKSHRGKHFALYLLWIYSRSTWTFNFNAQLSIFLFRLFFRIIESILELSSRFSTIKKCTQLIRLLIFLFHRFNLSHNSFFSISLLSCCFDNLIEKI